MEATPSFDLNSALRRWREDLAGSAAFRGQDLDELEAHLADGVAALRKAGLSAEEAFHVATRRLGANSQLEDEFGKVNQVPVWLNRILWMLVGIQLWGLLSTTVGAVIRWAAIFGMIGFGHDPLGPHPAWEAALFTLAELLALAASLVFCSWIVRRKGSRFSAQLALWVRSWKTLTLVGVELGVLMLTVSGLNYTSLVLATRFLTPKSIGQFYTAFAYSGLLLGTIQVTAMIALTLILVRKRFYLRDA